jgi:GTPase SAR1 family protein
VQRTLALLCSVLSVKIGIYNRKLIELSADDRRRHFYVVGSSGSGKTSLLKNLIAQDLANGEGLAFFDPHGDAAEEVLSLIPSKRAGDLIYVNPADLERPVAWNPLFDVKQDDRPLVADGIVSAMHHVWHESWGPRMEWILLNCVRTLLDSHSTLLGIGHISTNDAFRRKALRKALDPSVRAFWAEFESWDDRYRREAFHPSSTRSAAWWAPPPSGTSSGSKSRQSTSAARSTNAAS